MSKISHKCTMFQNPSFTGLSNTKIQDIPNGLNIHYGYIKEYKESDWYSGEIVPIKMGMLNPLSKEYQGKTILSAIRDRIDDQDRTICFSDEDKPVLIYFFISSETDNEWRNFLFDNGCESAREDKKREGVRVSKYNLINLYEQHYKIKLNNNLKQSDMETNNSIHEISREVASTFEFNALNRPINPSQISNLKKNIFKSENPNDTKMFVSPIIVNKRTNNVIEGQHRLKAFLDLTEKDEYSKATLGVMYVDITPKKEVELMKIMNNTTKRWQTADFINSYIKSKNPNYVRLEKFCNSHELTKGNTEKSLPKYRYGVAFIKGKNCDTDLRKGTFICTDDELEKGEIIHNEVLKIFDSMDINERSHLTEIVAFSWMQRRNDIKDFELALKELKVSKSFRNMVKDTKRVEDWKDMFIKLRDKIEKKY